MLSKYQIHKDKKSGILIDPKDVTVVCPVDGVYESVTTGSTLHAFVHTGPSDFVSAKQFKELGEKWDKRFVRYEALL